MIKHCFNVFIRTTYHPDGEFFTWSVWEHVDSCIIFGSPEEYSTPQAALSAGEAWLEAREKLSQQVIKTLAPQVTP